MTKFNVGDKVVSYGDMHSTVVKIENGEYHVDYINKQGQHEELWETIEAFDSNSELDILEVPND